MAQYCEKMLVSETDLSKICPERDGAPLSPR